MRDDHNIPGLILLCVSNTQCRDNKPQMFLISPQGGKSPIYISCERNTALSAYGIQKFPDWPPGERTANGIAVCQ
jgi:hypothetical protein